jgi:ankyrin repeat protein
MTYRRQEADRAHPETCGWILQHKSYRTWSTQGGLLWVKGNPGTGKSTLMAYVYRAFQAVPEHERHVILNFFFHGRGTTLQKTPTGMFRSLLHQLFTRARSVRGPIRKAFHEKRVFGEPAKDWKWQLKELQDLFLNGVTDVAKTRAITIFIDALDEAGVEAAAELVAYFHILNDRLIADNIVTRICISCRHYPVVSDNSSLGIHVEDENYRDILIFVQDWLNSKVLAWEKDSNSIDACQALKDTIVEKASGVFQWAQLVVPMVIERLNGGESFEEIRLMLARVPERLGAVYAHILTNVIKAYHHARTLHLMQWICLAERPLSVTELRFAMASDDAGIHPSRISCKDGKGFVETDARMEKLIRSLSGGLAEVKNHKKGSTVQFVHQSVNDFLLSNGLTFLVSASVDVLLGQDSGSLMSSSSDKVVGRSQHRLSRSCINHLKLEEVLREDVSTHFSLSEPAEDKIKQKLPFVDYATKFWFLHAEKAEGHGISQEELVAQFKPTQVFKTWIKIYRSIDGYHSKCPAPGSTLLHVASSSNLQSTVRLLLAKGTSIEEEDKLGNRALHYAARWGHKELISMLLDEQARIGPRSRNGSTPLEKAAGNGHEEVVQLLLGRGAHVNARTGSSGSALQAAALGGRTILVKTLIRNGAEVNAQGGEFGNALQAAALEGHEAVVQLLLDEGAEVNAQGGCYDNALQAAAYNGHKQVLEAFFNRQLDVNTEDSQGRFGLFFAMRGNQQDIIEYMLAIGARVDPTHKDRQGCSALHFAASGGCLKGLKLIINSGANVNALDTNA